MPRLDAWKNHTVRLLGSWDLRGLFFFAVEIPGSDWLIECWLINCCRWCKLLMSVWPVMPQEGGIHISSLGRFAPHNDCAFMLHKYSPRNWMPQESYFSRDTSLLYCSSSAPQASTFSARVMNIDLWRMHMLNVSYLLRSRRFCLLVQV